MPWSGGTFNRANGATGWQDDQAANIGIEAGRHDTQDNDFRNGINATLTKDGTNSPTANLPMNGYRHTGAGNAVGDADYCTYGQAKAGVNIAVAGAVDHTISQYTSDANGGKITLQKARSGTIGTNTIVNDADTIGSVVFRGANGTTFSDAASISAVVNGTPGASNDMPGALVFSTSADASATPTERVRIGANGRVGIGTSAPGVMLELAGVSAEPSSLHQFLYTATNNPATLRHYRSRGTSVGSNVAVASGDNIGNWEARGADGSDYQVAARIRMTCNGTVSAGTVPGAILFETTDSLGVLNQVLTVNSAGIVKMFGAVVMSGIPTTASAANLFIDTSGSDPQVRRSTSSLRYKTNVEDYAHGLDKIKQLRPVSFQGIADGTQKFAGLIAEEVDAAGLEEFVQYDDEGRPDSLAYANMVALLIKAIQELEARVAALEGE